MFLAAVFAAGLLGPNLVASQPRCNDLVITEMQDRLRKAEGSVPAPDQRDARFAEFQKTIARLQDESLVLQSVCSENDFRPLATKLLATQGWALALESDLSKAEYAAECPAAEVAVTRGFVAEAWLRLTEAERDEPTRHSDAFVEQVEAKVRTRAKALDLTLPDIENTSDYWMRGIQSAGQEAAKGCSR